MTGDFLPFASREYCLMAALLFFARGMDLFSTRVATPQLKLEANPLARRLGWKFGIPVNVAVCIGFSFWPLPAIIIATSGLLVAAHNFKSAWLMRGMGEDAYRELIVEQIARAGMPLCLLCLFGETALTALIGAALVCFSGMESVPFAIGLGVLGYAAIVLFYTSLSLWRLRGEME
jgi:hypothetical protein